jgi:hypothetical protein
MMRIDWTHLVAIVMIAAAQASFAMNIARMKVFRTFRQKVLYWAAKAEAKRRDLAYERLLEWQQTHGVQGIPKFEYNHQFHGMSWARFFYELVACPYCLGHYIAFGLVLIYQPRPLITHWLWLDLTVSCFLIVTIAVLFAGLIHRALDPMPAYVDMDDPAFFDKVHLTSQQPALAQLSQDEGRRIRRA